MSYRDREWYIYALKLAKNRVSTVRSKIDNHIKHDEFDAAKMFLTDLADALSDANSIANQFADKFGG